MRIHAHRQTLFAGLRRGFNSLLGLGIAALAALSGSRAAAGDDDYNFDEAIGLEVLVEDSQEVNCGGSSDVAQQVTAHADITGGAGGKCPIKLAVTVTGVVETENEAYDYVYVNDVLFFSGNEAGGGCAMITKTVTKVVEVVPDDGITLLYDTADQLYHVGGMATITNVELVEEGCASGCEAGGGSMENGSVHVGLNLGMTEFGKSVGALRIVELVPAAVLGTPSSLRFSSGWEGVAIITDTNDAIRQVKATQCLADVVTETSSKFRVDFYNPDNIGPLTGGLYDQTGLSPYVSWAFENMDTTDNDHLRITQVKGSVSVVSEFIWDESAQGWELVEGNGFRKEKKSVVVDGVNQTRTVTSTVRNASDEVVSKEVSTYKDFAWGRELIQAVVDPEGDALTTTYTFYDDPVSDGESYGKPKSVRQPDGGWVIYHYGEEEGEEGRLVKTVEPFLDAPFGSDESLCKVTTIGYDDRDPRETRVTTILGNEVARSYKAVSDDVHHITEDIRCTVAGAVWYASSNLVTATKLVSSGEFTGETEWISRPDGTGSTFEYSKAAALRTVVRCEGEILTYIGADLGAEVVAGTRTTTVSDLAGNLVSELVEDIESGLTLSFKTVTSSDAFGRPTVIDFNDGTTETVSYGCCGVESRTDREGITTTYTYDDFKRVKTESRPGVITSYTYDPEGRILSRKRIGSDSSEIIQETNTYDPAGRLVGTKDALLNETTWDWDLDGSGRARETTTNADGGTVVTVTHKDGRTYEVSGTGTAPRRWEYGHDSGAGFGFFEKEIRLTSTGGAAEWTKSWSDLAGRVIRSQVNGQAAATRTYDANGNLAESVDPDGVVNLYSTEPGDMSSSTILDVDRSGVASASDRIDTITRSVVTDHSTVVRRTDQIVVNASGIEETASRTDVSADGRRSWVTSWGLGTSYVTTYGPAGTRTEVATFPDNSTQTRVFTQGRLSSSVRAASGGSPVLSSTSYGYDAHGRLETATDARNGTTSYTYDDMDRVLTVTTPSPGPGIPPQVTAYQYDSMGRRTVTTLPDLSQTTNEWYPKGTLKKRSGSQVPTVEYTYDAQGRKKTMTTTGQAGPAVTTWTYEPETGRLSAKEYPGGDSVSYTYTEAGRLLARDTSRGVQRTYTYDDGGRATGVDYSDATPDVVYTLNRLGQVAGISDGVGTRTRTVSTDGRLLTETYDTGLLAGSSVGHGYDTLLRRETFTAGTGGPSFQTTWSYDGASRIETVASGSDTTTYAYEPNSGLVAGVTTQRGGATTLSSVSNHDHLDRLTSISSSAGGTTVSSHGYSYDSLNRRTGSVLENGMEWDYGYDAMGQIISGTKKTVAGVPVPGMVLGYTFDGIGNRTSATINGRTGTYASDTANQYTSRQVPGVLDIRGRADVSAKVTINTEPTQRFDEYFYGTLEADNSSAPQYPDVSVTAVANLLGPNDEDLIKESNGSLFLPCNPESFTYDDEGNLESDGRWTYTWDGANRLTGMETNAAVPAAAKRKLEFAYDAEGRRSRKQVSTWDGSSWALQSDRRYLYDGWDLIAELDAFNAMLRNFVWGLDLSRTPQGAGGVGGLLAIREGTESHLPCYDGNGNVMALVRSSDLGVSARYEYGPFGETLIVDEDGVSNPFRFSTKFRDQETGLLYYGYRYYDTVTGRWPSRDPIEEWGGVNLYGFVNNNGVLYFDRLGNAIFIVTTFRSTDPQLSDRATQLKITEKDIAIIDEFLTKLDALSEELFAEAVEGGRVRFNGKVEPKGTTKSEYRDKVKREKTSFSNNVASGGAKAAFAKLQEASKSVKEPHDLLVFVAHGGWNQAAGKPDGTVDISGEFIQMKDVARLIETGDYGSPTWVSCYKDGVNRETAYIIPPKGDVGTTKKMTTSGGVTTTEVVRCNSVYFNPFGLKHDKYGGGPPGGTE